jgi:opine dehydrogenase
MMGIREVERVAIIGAGNGGFAAAADFTKAGYDVRLYGRSQSTIDPVIARGGIEFEGVLGEGFAPLRIVTSDASKAMHGADVILMMGPTHAHEDMARVVAPHLTRDQILLAAPGHTLTLLPNALRAAGAADAVFCETATLPYICRKTAPDRVKVSRRAARLKFSAFPATRTEQLAEALKALLPALSPVPTLLDTVFPYTNAIHHPPALLCNIGRVEATGGDYYHYYEGITPSVGRIIDALDRERLAIAAAFGCKIDKLSEYFFQIGYTNEDGRAGGGAYSVFHNSEPNRWIKAPATIDYRFFNEDIPYGLVPLTELGQLAAVATPASNAVIELASIATGKSYREIGLTRKRLGIDGLDASSLKLLLEKGYPA